MREIKFRFYSKQHNKMLYEVRSFKEDGIMQYTGMKDSNGIEIYEGDIIHVIAVVSDEIGVECKYDAGVGYVIYDSSEGMYTLNGYSPNNIGLYECKVIGNIYENPELIK